ncbi:VWA domain-containing protein, partial [Enterococcus faecium]
YATNNVSTPGEEDTNVPAQTVHLWGKERNFEPSYLDNNGAYIKKCVEHVLPSSTASDLHPEDAPTLYNVYLDGSAGEKNEISPIDMVFVVYKSARMS